MRLFFGLNGFQVFICLGRSYDINIDDFQTTCLRVTWGYVPVIRWGGKRKPRRSWMG